MSGICPSCGSSGQANRDCADKSSQILWDGGALCLGISDGTLNDIIRYMAISICNISGSLSSLSVSASDVTMSGQIGTCISTQTTLAGWITAMETYLCSLNTTVAALDFTEPLYYNDTPTILDIHPTFYVSDTITIPANTVNETMEYLKLEVWAEVTVVQTGESALRVSFLGEDIDFVFSSAVDGSIKSPYKQAKIEINFVRNADTTMQYDWSVIAQRWMQEFKTGFLLGGTVSPVDWSASNNMVISAYNETNSFTISRIRLTKFNIH